MRFRKYTTDEDIFNSINLDNEYNLPDSLSENDIIVDIGCHIGSFSYACLARGAGKVYAFEAWYNNYCCAAANLSEFVSKVSLTYSAVWKSNTTLSFVEASDRRNTGGGNVWSSTEGNLVPAIALDEVLEKLPYVTILKLDCEGSEFPILFSSKLLGRVNSIVGEYHEFEGDYDKNKIPPHMKMGDLKFTIEELSGYLESCGFTVSSKRSKNDGKLTNIGIFTATR